MFNIQERQGQIVADLSNNFEETKWAYLALS